MLKIFRLYSLFAILIFFSIVSYSQGFSDLSAVNFSDLNSSQIDLILRRATSQGYNQFDLLKIAQSQGMSQADLEKLDKRFKSAQTVARVSANSSTPLEDTRMRKRWVEEMEIFRDIKKNDIFGYNVFRGNNFLKCLKYLDYTVFLQY